MIRVFPVWLLLLSTVAVQLILPAGVRAERIEPEEVDFTLPFSLSLAPGVAVFFQGREFRGGISLYRGERDTIRVQSGGIDLAAWPRPRSVPAPVSIRSLERIYGGVPYVKNRLTSGDEGNWREVTADYRAMQRETRFEMAEAYWNVLDGDSTDLSGALDGALGSLVPYRRYLDGERGLFERTGEDVILFWKGRKPCAETVLLHTGRFRRRTLRGGRERSARKRRGRRSPSSTGTPPPGRIGIPCSSITIAGFTS